MGTRPHAALYPEHQWSNGAAWYFDLTMLRSAQQGRRASVEKMIDAAKRGDDLGVGRVIAVLAGTYIRG